MVRYAVASFVYISIYEVYICIYKWLTTKIAGITEAFKADSFEKKINLGKADCLHYPIYVAFRFLALRCMTWHGMAWNSG